MASAPGSCCPPSSAPYLAADSEYVQKGTVVEAGTGGVPCYATGDSNAEVAVIVVPDVWGFNGGRVRALADTIASTGGYSVLVPKLLVPEFEGGTDGDGLPPDFDVRGPRAGVFYTWLSKIKWEVGANAVQPKIAQVIAFAKSRGAQRFGMVGFCWGGWVVMKTSALTSDVVCGAIPHPSAHVEAGLHNGDNVEMAKATRAPMLLLPGDKDPTDYDEGGAIFRHLQPGSATHRYPTMPHGWMTRGDAKNDEAVARAVQSGLDQIILFLGQHLRPAAPPAPVASPRHMSSASQQAINMLQVYSRSLEALEAEAGDIRRKLGSRMLDAQALGALKATIARANGQTERLQCVQIDGVMTGGLHSGRADAKATRKSLTHRAEALSQRLAALHKDITAYTPAQVVARGDNWVLTRNPAVGVHLEACK